MRKSRGSKRKKWKKRPKNAKNNDYRYVNVVRDSNYNTSACVGRVGALGRISTHKRCLCLEQGIPARQYGRTTLRGGALHTTLDSVGSSRSESKCERWVMSEFW